MLHPDIPREGVNKDEFFAKKFGSSDRIQQMQQFLVQAGQKDGINFNFCQRIPSTLRAHQLLKEAEGQGLQNELAEVLFRLYFEEGKDVSEVPLLKEAAQEVHMDVSEAFLYSDAHREYIRTTDKKAKYHLGVSGVPFFVLNHHLAFSGAQDVEVFEEAFDELNNVS
eukprot:gb/GECH01009473.1/.p1 GENE.gb/GECH01009473.1/~~gb/GECH01009473.1/.p1  ORF type:complete len:167 (+),score=55.14 gb/GECH01009473.1/:1-501(+)